MNPFEKNFTVAKLVAALFFIVSLMLTLGAPATLVSAHGGGLDSSGGHNCYVGSCAGTYHCHRCGGSSTYTYKPAITPAFCVVLSSARMSSKEVRLMQGALFFKGFNPGPLDGIFGNKTSYAIKRYEIANRIQISPNRRVYLTTLMHLNIDC
jgi:hypothetical protein